MMSQISSTVIFLISASLVIIATQGRPSSQPIGPIEGNDGLSQTDQKQYIVATDLLGLPLNFSLKDKFVAFKEPFSAQIESSSIGIGSSSSGSNKDPPSSHSSDANTTGGVSLQRRQLDRILKLSRVSIN